MNKDELLKKIALAANKVSYEIDPEKCKKCGLCQKNCPANAIEGKPSQIHKIIPEKCIFCGSCYNICPFKAVIKKNH